MTDPRTAWRSIDWAAHESRVTIDGRTVNLVDIGHGPVVLLVHGLGGTWQSWLENIPTLAADHRVIAVDQPGFGGSDILPVGADFTAYATTLASVLELLDVRDVHLVGHSFGGLVVQQLAATRPDLVASSTFVSAGAVELSRARLAAVMGALMVARIVLGIPGVARAFARVGPLRRLLMRAALRDPRSITRELAEQTVPRINAPGFATAVRFGTAALSGVQPHEVRSPALVIWGRYDRLIPVAAGEKLHQDLPDSRLVLLDAGHCVMFERPSEFNSTLVEFLRSLTHDVQHGTKSEEGILRGDEGVAG